LKPVYVQKTAPVVVLSAQPSKRTLMALRGALILLAAMLIYLVFTIACMVPAARGHFIDLLLSPNFSLFMNP